MNTLIQAYEDLAAEIRWSWSQEWKPGLVRTGSRRLDRTATLAAAAMIGAAVLSRRLKEWGTQ